MAVLCRVAGIPARVATGFAPGAQDGTQYDLRGQDKHAWTQVYFPGAGWLSFDATIGTPTDGSVPSPALRRSWDLPALLHRLGALPVVLGAVILGLLLYVAKTEWYDRWLLTTPVRNHGHTSRQHIGRRYERMARALAALGLPRGAAETPSEYARRAQVFLAGQGGDAPDPETVSALTAHLVAARYGASEPGDVGDEGALRAFTAAALRLRLCRLRRSLISRAPRTEA
jgi:hypothetical protein